MTSVAILVYGVLLPAVLFLGLRARVGESRSAKRIFSEETVLGQSAETIGTGRFLVVYLSVLAGMISVAMYRVLDGGAEAFTPKGALAAVLVSPLVVRVVLGDTEAVAVLPWWRCSLGAYQSGFCWEAVIGGVLEGNL